MLAAQSPGVSLIIPGVAHLEPDFVDVVALRRLAPGLIAPMHVDLRFRKRSDARLGVPLPGAGFRVSQSLLGGSGVPLLGGLAIQAPPDGRPALGKRGARRRRAGIQGILPIMLGRWCGSSLAAEVAIMGRLCRQAMAAGNPALGAPDPCVDRGCGAYPLLEQCGRRPACVRRRVRVEGIPKGWPIACEGVQGLVCPATWQGLCEDNCSGPIHNAATKNPAGLLLAVQASIVPFDVFKKEQSIAGALRGKCGANATAVLRAAFEALPGDRRKELEDLAAATKDIARRNRGRVGVGSTVPLPVTSGQIPLRPSSGSNAGGELGNTTSSASRALVPLDQHLRSAAGSPPLAMNHWVSGDVWLALRSSSTCAELQATPVLPHPEPDTPEELLPRDFHTPMSIHTLDANHREVIERGSNLNQVSRECLEKFSHFCKAELRLSGAVEYPAMCGAMCRNPERTQRWLTKMREEMVSHFKLLVDASGGAKATMRSEHVVLVQAGVDGGGESARFFTIAASLAHSGPHPAAQVFVESSLVEQSVTLDPNAPSEHVAGVLAGSRLVLTEGPSRQMSPSRRLPPVFEASTRAPPLCLYTCDELVADILNAAPTTVLVQVVLAQPTERLDTLEITGANDHRFIVSRGKPAVLLPMRRSMPTSRDDIDLFEAIRPQRPHSVANELVAEVVHNPIGDGSLGDGGFKSLGDMIRDMFGLPSGDPLVAELGECEAELSRHSPLEGSGARRRRRWR